MQLKNDDRKGSEGRNGYRSTHTLVWLLNIFGRMLHSRYVIIIYIDAYGTLHGESNGMFFV